MKLKVPVFSVIIFLISFFTTYSFFSLKIDNNQKSLSLSSEKFELIKARAGDTDSVTITRAQWQPRKKRKWRVIVIATSDAPPGTVKLNVEVLSGDLIIRTGEMEYKKRKKHYSKVFVKVRNVKTPPETAVVKSSGGGSARALITRSGAVPETEE